ncbi:HAD family hydrolase [Gemella morbillorum]|uniref:HAD family hydrolase n=2 Tax=Gemella morbillorum TaxID=29391 RepID=UPI0028D30B54|nr:HAD family hydrolase [Gemella morbillorum]
MIKHLFSDMDGTVLNSNGQMSEFTIKTIKGSGLPFTLVSARSPQKMEEIINNLGIDGIHVAFNGGLIFEKNNKGNKMLYSVPLEYGLAKKLVLDVRNKFKNIGISLYDELYWNTDLETAGIKREYKIVKVAYKIVNFKNYFENTNKTVYKVSFIEHDEEVFKKLIDYVEQNYSKEQLTIQKSLSGYLEITHANAKKSKGIEYIQQLEKLEKNELAAFGDGQNDIPMFESVGYVVVMENATEDVKKYADFITKSNNDDGVAYAIEKYIKNI